jgi:hypothetical protein
MKTVPECSLKWNVRIQELNRLAMIAEYRQTEMRQDKNAVADQHPPLVSRTMRFARRRVLRVA